MPRRHDHWLAGQAGAAPDAAAAPVARVNRDTGYGAVLRALLTDRAGAAAVDVLPSTARVALRLLP